MSRISWIVAAVAGLCPPLASAQEFAGTPLPGGGVVAGPIAGAPIAVEPITTAPITAGPIVSAPFAGATGGVVVGEPVVSGPVHPYSYYIEFPAPARTYVPYGPTDIFPFQGQAYGHAYDRWTWPAMSGASGGVGRYYQILR